MNSSIFSRSLYFSIKYWVSMLGVNFILALFVLFNSARENVSSFTGPASMYELFNVSVSSSTSLAFEVISFIASLIILFFLAYRFLKIYPDTQPTDARTIAIYFFIIGFVLTLLSVSQGVTLAVVTRLVKLLVVAFLVYFFIHMRASRTNPSNLSVNQQETANAINYHKKQYRNSYRTLIVILGLLAVVYIAAKLGTSLNPGTTETVSDNSGLGFGLLFFGIPLVYVLARLVIRMVFHKKQMRELNPGEQSAQQ